MLDKTVKCPICGKPYVFCSMMAGDQSACPECREEAWRAVRRPSTTQEQRRRQEFFGLGGGAAFIPPKKEG